MEETQVMGVATLLSLLTKKHEHDVLLDEEFYDQGEAKARGEAGVLYEL